MINNIDPEWWKKLFDETYLITDSRSVCDNDLTRREVDFLEQVLRPGKPSAILDLCGGQGRHSMELSRRGFTDITVLDYSEFLINLGRDEAQKEGLNITFLKKDARDTGLADEHFQFIIMMASSLGYFMHESENEKMLREAYRLLLPGGSFLLDLPNREYVLNHFNPHTWHEASEEIVVCRQRRLDKDFIFTREMVISKSDGLIRDEGYCTRLYRPEEIAGMLTSAGFRSVEIGKDFVSHAAKMDYGCMTNRMIVIARKS